MTQARSTHRLSAQIEGIFVVFVALNRRFAYQNKLGSAIDKTDY